MNQMLEMINLNKGNQQSQQDSGFFSFWRKMFSSSADSQHLEEQRKLKYVKN